jgi:hypothetical protein
MSCLMINLRALWKLTWLGFSGNLSMPWDVVAVGWALLWNDKMMGDLWGVFYFYFYYSSFLTSSHKDRKMGENNLIRDFCFIRHSLID